MSKSFSAYLDFLRLFAAFVVFFGHFSHSRFSGELFSSFRGLEHDAVILFFVLSGYVIAFVSSSKDFSFKSYLISRLSRLYSVVLPAIFLTIVADGIGRLFNLSLYEGIYSGTYSIVRVFVNLLFVQEFWGAGVRLFSNGPFWSLSYEFAYYMLFAFCVYFSGPLRVLLLVVGIALVGPNIILLAPVWLLGVWAYYSKINRTMSVTSSFVGAIFVMALYVFYKVEVQRFMPIYTDFSWSSKFLHDYVVGVLVFIELYFVRSLLLSDRLRSAVFGGKITGFVKLASSFTFSLYLYHFPLLLVVFSVVDIDNNDVWALLGAALIVLGIVVFLGFFTERKKHIYTKALGSLLNSKSYLKLGGSTKSPISTERDEGI